MAGPLPPPSRTGELVGGVLVGLTSLQFGGVVVLAKVLSRTDLPVASVLALRFAVAAAVLAVVLMALRQRLRPGRGAGWRLGLLGAVGYAGEAGLFFASLRHASVPAATLLFYTYPVWVALLAMAVGRGPKGWTLRAALAASLAGAALVVVAGGGVEIDGAGVAFALGSAVTFAAYLTLADAVLRRSRALVGAMTVSASAAGGLAGFALVTGTARVPVGWDQWGPVVGMGILTAGAFVCLFAGLRRLGPVRTSIIAATEPLTASLLAVLFLEEAVRLGTGLGGLLILAGAMAAALARAAPPPEPPGP